MNPARAAIFVSVCLAVLGSPALAQPGGGGGPPPQRVRVETLRMETVERRREATGEVRAVRTSRVAAEEAGLLVEVLVDVGDEVEEGQRLAMLRDERRRIEVDQRVAEAEAARADVIEREAQVEKAARDVKRLEALLRQAGASETEVDDGRTRLKEAEARLARAEADLGSATALEATARQRLADLEIKAPFAGSITAKFAEIGAWAREGDSIFELVELGRVDVYIDVPERFLRAVASVDAKVELRIPALEKPIEAGVDTIIAQGDRLARTFPVRFRLENRDGFLRPGMSVVGMVPTQEPMEALTVSKDAVLWSESGAFVYFDSGGSAAIAPVETLFAVGDRLVVRSPALRPGMRVIVEGNERVFPGQPLLITNEPGDAEAGVAARGGN